MAKEYTHVRVETATLKELQRVRDSMLLAEEMGLVELDKDARERFSFDQVINRLIAFREKHKARVRRSKARRASRLLAAAPAGPGDAGGDPAAGGRASTSVEFRPAGGADLPQLDAELLAATSPK